MLINMEFKKWEEKEKFKNKQPKRREMNQRRFPYGNRENSFNQKSVLFVTQMNIQFLHENL